MFTKSPNQWRDPRLPRRRVTAFRAELEASNIAAVLSHDSYLINLASPNRRLRARSIVSFRRELARCRDLSIPYVVSHPGNYRDDREAGLECNATAYQACLAAVVGPMILIEGTAGTGTALGSRFEELEALRRMIAPGFRERVASAPTPAISMRPGMTCWGTGTAGGTRGIA